MYQLRTITTYTSDKESKEYAVKAFEKFLGKHGMRIVICDGMNTVKDENNRIISVMPVKLGTEDPQSEIDLTLCIDSGGTLEQAATEVKERKRNKTTGALLFNDSYGTFSKAGWVLEDIKREAFRIADLQGFIPLYLNVFADGICRIWNMNTVPESEKLHGQHMAAVSTAEPSKGQKSKDFLYLKNVDGWAFDGEGNPVDKEPRPIEELFTKKDVYIEPTDPRDIFE